MEQCERSLNEGFGQRMGMVGRTDPSSNKRKCANSTSVFKLVRRLVRTMYVDRGLTCDIVILFSFHFILIYLNRVKLSTIQLLYKLPCTKKHNPLKIYNIQYTR